MGKLSNNQVGFTLIELTAVIVILGILAAFAIPRFADLSSEARVATLEALRGNVSSAASIIKSKSILESTSDAPFSSIEINGQTIDLEYGAPAPTASGIGIALNADWAADLSRSFVYVRRNDELMISPSGLYNTVPTQAQMVASACYLIYYQELPNTPFRVFIPNSNGC
ncbi:Tfp pilus assembly protein FimT/FimU [Marinibactrum halimedae]|uniref:Pilin structural protein V10 n=1 Tax=Marinibactrum halimedae TaxID=1444977 RepID=A0AA37T462_9GAMM|nr:type II secretion system protein [Marinibactrum halimedae]MCD9460319.1 type II secretion system GspH family protein [Marinibactrum halimedae]GLS26753.1 pilin structural protein V10 [Marinibactrum halimedae]